MNETLKQIRINALQYSEKDMARKLGISLSEYKKIEDKPLEMGLLIKLAQAVGKPIDNLVNTQKQEIKFDIDDAFQTVDELKDKEGLSNAKEPDFLKMIDGYAKRMEAQNKQVSGRGD